MPVPKRKCSKARRGKRSAGLYKSVSLAGSCQTCQAPLLSHNICAACGYYKGVKVIRTKAERAHERGQVRQSRVQSMQARGNSPIEAHAEEEKSA